MNQSTAGAPMGRDRSTEILERSNDLWRRWRALRDAGDAGDALRPELLELLQDTADAGVWVISPVNREMLTAEIEQWRRWFADELGEYLPPVDLAPAVVPDEKLPELDYSNLMILLKRGEVISSRLVQGIEFAKHLDEVREAFSESKLINCRFEQCKFDGTRFGAGTKLVYVTFSECTMDYLIWP